MDRFKSVICVLLILTGLCASAQTKFVPASLGGGPGIKSFVKGAFIPDSGYIMPHFADTTRANEGPTLKKTPFLVIAIGPALYMRSSDTARWIHIGAGADNSYITADSLWVVHLNEDGTVKDSTQYFVGDFSGSTESVSMVELSTGAPYTVDNLTYLVVYTSTSLLASAALTFPPDPVNGQTLDIHFIGDITSFTLSPNSGQSISQPFPITTISAGDHLTYQWISSLSKWIAKQ